MFSRFTCFFVFFFLDLCFILFTIQILFWSSSWHWINAFESQISEFISLDFDSPYEIQGMHFNTNFLSFNSGKRYERKDVVSSVKDKETPVTSPSRLFIYFGLLYMKTSPSLGPLMLSHLHWKVHSPCFLLRILGLIFESPLHLMPYNPEYPCGKENFLNPTQVSPLQVSSHPSHHCFLPRIL